MAVVLLLCFITKLNVSSSSSCLSSCSHVRPCRSSYVKNLCSSSRPSPSATSTNHLRRGGVSGSSWPDSRALIKIWAVVSDWTEPPVSGERKKKNFLYSSFLQVLSALCNYSHVILCVCGVGSVGVKTMMSHQLCDIISSTWWCNSGYRNRTDLKILDTNYRFVVALTPDWSPACWGTGRDYNKPSCDWLFHTAIIQVKNFTTYFSTAWRSSVPERKEGGSFLLRENFHEEESYKIASSFGTRFVEASSQEMQKEASLFL